MWANVHAFAHNNLPEMMPIPRPNTGRHALVMGVET
jgi:hypothetical protein